MLPYSTENIADNIIQLPLLHRKIVKRMVSRNNIGLAQLHILLLLDKEDKLPMYEIADRMSVSKPNLTPLVDKLFDLGYIERRLGELDRRITFISLTGKGKAYIYNYKQNVMEIISSMFSSMSQQDYEKLGDALDTVIDFFQSGNVD